MAAILGAAYSQFAPSAPVKKIAPHLVGRGIPIPTKSKGTAKIEAMSRTYQKKNGERIVGISFSIKFGAYSGDQDRTVIFIPMSELEQVSVTLNGVILES